MIAFYEQRARYKALLIGVLLLIFAASVIYTNYMGNKLAAEERKKIELLAMAYKHLNEAGPNTDISFLFHVIESNKTIPVIVTDEAGEILYYRNFDSVKIARDPTFLPRQLQQLAQQHDPVPIEYAKGKFQYVYYHETSLLQQLRYFPFVQFFFIALFIIVAYVAMNTVRRAEQNRLWAGMAKETAHQLGTPISALSGWVDYLKLQPTTESLHAVLKELEQDIQRLETIAHRFSHIGSAPKLIETDIVQEIQRCIDYVRRRAPESVRFQLHTKQPAPITALCAPTLFEWVIENLLKNALDAIPQNGQIDIYVDKQDHHVFIDVKDNGKGIPIGQSKTIFAPGFSTKKRGWGLGLSLAKRIIEHFHDGRIMVKESAPGKGTTFRIILKG